MCLFLTTNCWKVDSSENRTFDRCWIVQSRCFLANASLLAFMTGVSLGFRAGLYNFRLNSLLKRREMVIWVTLVPFRSKAAWRFFVELVGERTTILRMRLSSQMLVFRGLPLRFLSQNISSERCLVIAWCTPVLLTLRRAAIWRLDTPSLCRMTIWTLWTSVKDFFFAHFGLRKFSKKCRFFCSMK